MDNTSSILDRAMGSIVGSAVGDALGVGYEFANIDPELIPKMIGGGLGNFSPGEWSDDTSMAFVVATSLAQHGMEPAALDAMGKGWHKWYKSSPKDIGVHTAKLMAMLPMYPKPQDYLSFSKKIHEETGKTGGNGSLMRVAPIGVASALVVEKKAIKFAKISSALTHWDRDAGIACALWMLAIREVIIRGELPQSWLSLLTKVCETDDELKRWQGHLDAANVQSPHTFTPNGYVVPALQASLSVIKNFSPVKNEETFKYGLTDVIRIGNDTDTTAAILGGLLGAYVGYKNIPKEWIEITHGWPNKDSKDLTALTKLIFHKRF